MVVKQSVLNKGLYVLLLIIFVSSFIFSAYYFTTGRDTINLWFFSLNDCIYRRDNFSTDFFTPHVKEMGDRWCLLAMAVSVAGSILVIWKWVISQASVDTVRLYWPGKALLWPLIIAIVSIGLWTYSYLLSAPAYDEIFSAVYPASGHPFQALAYYMLPNNHIFFNVLNNIVGHPFDKIVSGRVLSLIAYVGVLLTVFYWLKGWGWSNINAFLATLLIAVQLPVLGFSSQARGYELQLLAGWVAFVSLFKYYEGNKSLWLKCHSFACIIGYATVPTFLYFHAAILLFSFVSQLHSRKADLTFWMYQLICCAFVFLFYLPSLCFSGLSSFSDNPTVKSSGDSVRQFLPVFIHKFRYFISFCFSFLFGEDNIVNYVLFLLPLCLCFFKNRIYRMIGLFYATMWIMFIVLVLYLKKAPFSRNLIIHYSITLGLVGFTLYQLIDALCRRLNANLVRLTVFPAIGLCLTIHYLVRYQRDGNYMLYFNPVNEIYRSFSFANTLPREGSIAFSDESFYLYYLCLRNHYSVSQCAGGDELYYIKTKDERLPAAIESNYYWVQTLPNNFDLYRKRMSDTSIILD